MNATEIKGLKKLFRGMYALDGLDMTVPVGSIYGFIGENGSGYSKNLFTVRANKTDYVISKSIVGFVAGASMLVAFFIGAMLGGAMAGLPFALEGVNALNIILSMLSKIFLVSIFSSIYLIAAVFVKQRLWLSLILSFAIGMLF